MICGSAFEFIACTALCGNFAIMAERFEGKRIRDPVHGLIVFEEGNPRDELAWKLLNTPEMQRLRRIRQLGVSEFVYPGATHSRFAHSVGVYHTAKQLVEIIKRECKRNGVEFEQDKADDAILAALLHDIGHGPFSHAFERAQKARGIRKRHEEWTADIIRNPDGDILPILGEERAERIAAMLQAEDPSDIYHAVFSSSFDADRLDYIRRDRMMTGTHAGHIDFDWLMDNLRVREIDLSQDEGDEKRLVPTFCFTAKAIPAAEQFLLARYTLHEQVYLHKTTRAMEIVIMRLFRRLGELATEDPDKTGLPANHPLLRFLASGEPSVQDYLALDDMMVFAALDSLMLAKDEIVRDMARRLFCREPFKPLCILTEYGSNPGAQEKRIRKIDERFAEELNRPYGRVVKEHVPLKIYSLIGEDDERAFKKIHVLDGNRLREIADVNVSRMIFSLSDKPKEIVRYYFADPADREQARG